MPSLSFFSLKTWVPGWIFHEGSRYNFLPARPSFLKKCDVALFWKEAPKEGIIERFDKTSSRIRPSSKLKYYKKLTCQEGTTDKKPTFIS